jgi:hypothetical protein
MFLRNFLYKKPLNKGRQGIHSVLLQIPLCVFIKILSDVRYILHHAVYRHRVQLKKINSFLLSFKIR